jgi:hypothetical protein
VPAISSTDSASSTLDTRYTTFGPNTYSRPPSTGPAITATWKVEELSATACAEVRVGTRLRSTACEAGIMKARALPYSTSTANTGHTASAGQRKAHQQQAAQQLGAMHSRIDVAAVVGVGHVAGPQDQHQEGRELRQADQAEVEQAVGDLVDLPADGHALHLHGEGAEEAGGQVEGEITVAQDGSPARR